MAKKKISLMELHDELDMHKERKEYYKKKYLEWKCIGVGFLIILGLFLLIQISNSLGIGQLGHTSYHIYENGCNESDLKAYAFCNSDCIFWESHSSKSHPECYDNCNKFLSCEKEVNEIVLETFGKEYRCFNEKNKVIFYVELQPMRDIDKVSNSNCQLIREEGQKVIKKSDLRKDWLDNTDNCSPLYVWSYLSNAEYDCMANNCSKDICLSKDYKCLRYRCGNYEVTE